ALAAAGRDARALGGVRLAAIGPGTAAALAVARLVPDLVPERFVAESLLDAFPDPPAAGGRVLLPRAAGARDVLPDDLRARRWTVEVVEAYRTEPLPIPPEAVAEVAKADAIAFASASAVRSFVAAAGPGAAPPAVVCIGPVTAEAARSAALTVAATADPSTLEGLVDAVAAALRDKNGER
ncbi:MAG: uroporphyrinogen-III synthase, partial [Acidimicrobiales bacterium]